MTRLDSAIRRLEAQRACLDFAAAEIATLAGPVLELGLGNGRTYDHLRARLPGREIFVFDRRMAAHPDCVPPPAYFIEGDVTQTLAAARARLPGPAALVHCDIGTGEKAANRRLAAAIAPLIDAVIADGGLVVSDQEMGGPDWRRVALPEGVAEGRYNIRRVVRART